MPVYARVIMVLVAAFLGWTMLRAARSGTVIDDARSYVEGDQPNLFVFIMIARFFCILFCLWLAAGYTPQEFAAELGLGSLGKLLSDAP